MSIFPHRLKETRKSKKQTQRQVASGIGISENHYQFYEYGKNEPGITIVIKLAQYFNVPADYLLGLGLFSAWDTINEHWDAFMETVSNESKTAFPAVYDLVNFYSFTIDRIAAVQILNCFIENIVFDEELKIFKIEWKY